MRWRVFFCYASDHAQFIGSTVRNTDRKSTRLNSSHLVISYAVFCLKKKKILRQLTVLLPLIPPQRTSCERSVTRKLRLTTDTTGSAHSRTPLIDDHHRHHT